MRELPFVISVVRSGGFAGMRQEWTIEVTATDEAERWHPMIEACPWDGDDVPGHPDGFVYTVSAADHLATIPANRLNGPWRQLVDEVRRQASGPTA
jgi:hypothetical protein